MIDVSEHIPILYRVIGQLRLSTDEVEEAYSEGLVALTEAGLSYDAQRGPLVNWLANSIRWSLLNWITKERQRRARTFSLDAPGLPEPSEKPVGPRAELSQALAQARVILTEEERLVVYALALGYKGYEIAKHLHRSPTHVTFVKHRAHEKLRRLLGLPI